jgi:hypothetical protein
MPTVGIVTGAARGMGLACAERLVDTVDRLVLVDLDEAALTAVTGELSSDDRRAVVETFVLDVTDDAGLQHSRTAPASSERSAPSRTQPGSRRPWPTGGASSRSTWWGQRGSPKLSARS